MGEVQNQSSDLLYTQYHSRSLSLADITKILGGIPFLKDVSPDRIKALIKASFLRSYDKGQKITREGEHGHSMFVLLSGSVSVEAYALNGEAMKLATFAVPGDWFGEGAVLGRTRRSATIIAGAATLLLEIERIRLEKIEKAHETVLPRLAREANRRSMQLYFSRHRAFSQLSPAELSSLLEQSTLMEVERGTELYQERDPVENVIIIKSGVAKLFRAGEGGISVLAYYNSGDVIGLHDGQLRPGTLVTMGFSELISVSKRAFWQLTLSVEGRIEGWSQQFQKAEIAQGSQVLVPVAGQTTIFNFVDALVADGAQQAQSLLTIDLDLCIRCGNCVRSCEARHGNAKMTRRGKKLMRRRDMEVKGDHQPILIPSSCRHCDSPECMIGCPTGAIHRKPTGEVAVHDFCIGCSNCAIRCPWDNITMVETPGRTVNGLATPKIASKCDLCAGFDEPNCVHNCPTKAILRVEPMSYFAEVRSVVGGSAARAVGGARTRTKEAADRSRLVLRAIAGVLAAGLVALYASARPYYASSWQGLTLGGLALLFMLAATALAARRRMNRVLGLPRREAATEARSVAAPSDPAKTPAAVPSVQGIRWPTPAERRARLPTPLQRLRTGALQLGPFFLWTRAHVLLGALAFVAVLLHSGLRAGGFVTALLLIATALEIATGLFGVAFQRWFPRVVSRLERDSLLEEDIRTEGRAIEKRRQEMLADTSEDVRAASRLVAGVTGRTGSPLAKGYDSARAEATAIEFVVRQVGSTIDPPGVRVLERLAQDAVRTAEIRAILNLYRVRKGWLVVHIGITAALLSLVVLHVASVAVFWLRSGS